ncbi:PadR family transcriptional regulator [Peptostreptococcus porci]
MRYLNTQFRKGALELCVLAMIYYKDMYGYEIVRNISESMDVNEGTIYPILRRLTKEKYFETYMVDSSGGPARKYYSLTESGIEFLNQQKKEWYDFVKGVDLILRRGIDGE